MQLRPGKGRKVPLIKPERWADGSGGPGPPASGPPAATRPRGSGDVMLVRTQRQVSRLAARGEGSLQPILQFQQTPYPGELSSFMSSGFLL